MCASVLFLKVQTYMYECWYKDPETRSMEMISQEETDCSQ